MRACFEIADPGKALVHADALGFAPTSAYGPKGQVSDDRAAIRIGLGVAFWPCVAGLQRRARWARFIAGGHFLAGVLHQS